MKMSMEHWWNDTERGKANTQRKSRPSANLFTTNITWTDLELNPGFHNERPATGHLIHGREHTRTDILLLLLLRRYNFREVLAFSTSVFHSVRSLMQSFQFVIFILVMLLFTSSSHLFFGLPSDLVSAGDHSYTFFLPCSYLA